jgi:hypothetical protein
MDARPSVWTSVRLWHLPAHAPELAPTVPAVAGVNHRPRYNIAAFACVLIVTSWDVTFDLPSVLDAACQSLSTQIEAHPHSPEAQWVRVWMHSGAWAWCVVSGASGQIGRQCLNLERYHRLLNACSKVGQSKSGAGVALQTYNFVGLTDRLKLTTDELSC